MSKFSIKYFLIGYIFLYVFTIGISLFFNVTQINKSKSNITKSVENPKYIAQTVGNSKLLAALNINDKVQAGPVDAVTDWAMQKIVSYAAKSVSNHGFIENSLVSMGNIAGVKVFTGCDAIDTLTEPNATCSDSAFGKFIDGSSTVSPKNQDVTNYKPDAGGSILGITNVLHHQANNHIDTLVDTNLYAEHTLQQIPFVGKNITNAQAVNNTSYMDFNLRSVALGPKFFEVWVTARNLTYLLIIIPAIALGFAIMFRMQIGPQTQVSLMQALPQFIVVILLITFSYPLCALIVQFAKPIVDIVVSIIWGLAYQANATALGGGAGGIIGTAVLIIFAAATSLLGSGGLVGIVGLAIGVIFIVFLTVVWVRYVISMFFQSFKLSFIIAFGPLILVTAAFPGRFDTIKNYFLNVSAYVMGIAAMSISASIFFAILLFAASINAIAGIAGFFFACGVLWKAPSIHKQVYGAMGAKPLFDTGGDPKRR